MTAHKLASQCTPNYLRALVRNLLGRTRLLLLLQAAVLIGATAAQASITYTQDTNLHDFTSTVNRYAEFITGSGSPYTPTSADIESGKPNVVIGKLDGVTVDFGVGNETSKILIFNYIDHVGFAWDAFQPYRISGSNNNLTWTPLSDAISAFEADTPGVDPHFTLKGSTGIEPIFINNTISSNNLGYETYFDFSSAGGPFRYYNFRYSTLTEQNVGQGEWEEELAGIASGDPPSVPDPSTWTTMLIGAGSFGLKLYHRARRQIRIM
jgi:hypothetical protein